MLHNWEDLFGQVIINAHSKTNSGDTGTWHTALYQLINESYAQPLHQDDKAVVCVLIALHEAVQGKVPLTELAEACVAMSKRADAVESCDYERLVRQNIDDSIREQKNRDDSVARLRASCSHDIHTRFLYAGKCPDTGVHRWQRLCERCCTVVDEVRGNRPDDAAPCTVY